MTLGESIKAARLQRDFTNVAQFARLCRLDYANYRRIEADEVPPTGKTLEKICEQLDCNIVIMPNI